LAPEWEKLAKAMDGIIKVGAVDMDADRVLNIQTSNNNLRMPELPMELKDSPLLNSSEPTRTSQLITMETEALRP
jgi:hypothetical protein